MIAVCNTVGLAVIIHIAQSADALIQLPIAEQVCLGAGKYAVVTVDNLLVAEHLCPYTYLINITFETAFAKGECAWTCLVLEFYVVPACECLHLLSLDKLYVVGVGDNRAQCICACAVV